MKYTLLGVDGNAFAIMGYVSKAMKKEGYGDKVEDYRREAKSSDYYHLVSVSENWLDKINNAKEKELSENGKVVKDFLKKHNLKDEAILGLEVFGQISDGEFEDCGDYDMDWSNCIEELKKKYPHCKEYSNETMKDWNKTRDNLDFSLVDNDFGEVEFISDGFVASILPSSIKKEVLRIIEDNIEEREEDWER